MSTNNYSIGYVLLHYMEEKKKVTGKPDITSTRINRDCLSYCIGCLKGFPISTIFSKYMTSFYTSKMKPFLIKM